MVQNARDLLEERETLLLIFTDGKNLDLDTGDGYASTGWWRMSPRRNPNRVVIYHKHSPGHDARIYIGDFVGKEQRPSDRRYKIIFALPRFIGETSATWPEFANDGKGMQAPLRYLTAE
jgi:hypothetical protein